MALEMLPPDPSPKMRAYILKEWGVKVPSNDTKGDNKYVHPSYTAKLAGLYEVTVNTTDYVSAITAVTKTEEPIKKKKHNTEDIIAEKLAEKKKNFNQAMMKHTISFGIGYCMMCVALFLSIQFPDLIHVSEWMVNTLQPVIAFTKCLVIMITISSLFSLYKSDIDSMQRNRFVFSFVSGITEGVGIASISCITTDIIVNLLSSGVIL